MKAINWSNVHCTDHYSRPIRDLDTRNNPADMAAAVARDGYAWPGGYEMVIVTDDNAVLCRECVRAEYDQVYGEAIRRENGRGWKPAAIGIIGCNMEGRVDCDHCGRVISDDEEAAEDE